MKTRNLLGWLALGAAALLVLVWGQRTDDPLFPAGWTVSHAEARGIALERLADLGELPEKPFVVVNNVSDESVFFRFQELLDEGQDAEGVRASRAYSQYFPYFSWRVTVYKRDTPSYEYVYRVRMTPDGRLTQLERRLRDQEGTGSVDPAVARRQADAFLVEQGFDLSRFDEPEVRSKDLETRTDTSLRYRDHERLFGDDVAYGISVDFAGADLVGFARYIDDPREDELDARFQAIGLWSQGWVFLPVLLILFMAVPFVRRYHAGEIGVHRGLQIAGVVLACGVVVMLMTAKTVGEGWNIGVMTRPQVTLVVVFQMIVIFFVPMGVMAFLSWSVGESLCRERWGRKLAGFDALFRWEWRNATFAQAALRGSVGGLVVAAAVTLAKMALRPLGLMTMPDLGGGPWWPGAAWFSVPLVLFGLAYALYTAMFGQLFLVSFLGRYLGRFAGPLVAALAAMVLFFPPVFAFPPYFLLAVSLVAALLFVGMFLRYGIFSAFLAQTVAIVAPAGINLLSAQDPSIQLHASLALLAVSLPLLLSLRYLASDEEFVYRYEDVPPHVRRIAERERQKVELETARRIQSSILPELPAQINGVKMAHEYLPATEVGGDFYDVLALEDGRLAVAVGDVAGHGVSSGLVMSMAKSALAVQVTFNPEVEAVFGTLNRMVYQSARKRLLTTLCYAVIDPSQREMFYASAGHLFPYRISQSGQVEALESVSYPLGVRNSIDIRVRAARLASGDCLFLFSDGVVEARADGNDEMFGFERLERSLARHAHRGVEGLRDGVLADLREFTRNGPQEDDLTVLALQVP